MADQRGAPTGADLIADVTALCLHRLAHDPALAARASGLYHLSAAGETTWHAYAQWLVAEARRLGATLRLSPERIVPIATADHPTPARRPANSLLDTRRLRQRFGLSLPHWQAGVERGCCVKSWTAASNKGGDRKWKKDEPPTRARGRPAAQAQIRAMRLSLDPVRHGRGRGKTQGGSVYDPPRP